MPRDFCFVMRFILLPLLALPRSQTRSFLMHSHLGLLSDSSYRLPRHSIVSEGFHAFLLLTIRVFALFFD